MGIAGSVVDPCKIGDDCERKRVQDYKFIFAAENTRCAGYISEKFTKYLAIGAVPVAVGGFSRAEYEAIAPPRSFIHIDDFGSVTELVQYLLYLDGNSSAYAEYHAWRQTHEMVEAQLFAYTALCTELNKPLHEQRASRFGGSGAIRAKAVADFIYNGTCTGTYTRWGA